MHGGELTVEAAMATVVTAAAFMANRPSPWLGWLGKVVEGEEGSTAVL